MGIINHDKTPKIEQTGSVKDGSSGGNILPPEDTPLNVNGQDNQQHGEKLLVMDGPLSKIYTQALNVVYAQSTETNISQESQQIDMTLVTDVDDIVEIMNKSEGTKRASYVYITDHEHLENGGVTSAFDRLRVALDMKQFEKKAVCIESNGRVTQKIAMLSDYARSMHIPVFFSRPAMMEYMKAL